ncbi:PP2C family serine/threonine-protein phosphatase [Dechloromonas sp. HYN0024]|uniref:PP2C family protein-serine/threonine phosphatase n=1 Tax=Dechloromonas sp. HYN0024 TaxID=2231055 RepID=UPI000E42D8DD|nr:protein phosphatase 2C domain-containing protein [Dechloromonas sp. HYN0024]AXS80673.1 serine/threonine-protein phosphatase [Dechloromonas sp. HYN0024]
MAIGVDACAAQHQGDRKEQQDRVAILPHGRQRGVALAVVADGMGGHTGGALAAEQVVHTAKTNLDQFSSADESPQKMLESSMQEAHTMIKASRFMNEMDPHSTAVMLLLQPGQVTWGHCGDSRLYHFRGDKLVHRSVDHSYVEHLVALGKITAEQALTHPNRNVLLASLGGQEAPKITLSEPAELVAGDAFVLCSDGLWAYFDDAELGMMVAQNSARQACELLIDMARHRARGTGDNLSLAIIKLVDVPATKKVSVRG